MSVLLQVSPPQFGGNLYFLLGFWFWVFVAVAAIIVAWTVLKMLLWVSQKKASDRKLRERKTDADGGTCLPVSRGICTRCGQFHDKVYHLPSGVRLCRGCYDGDEEERMPNDKC